MQDTMNIKPMAIEKELISGLKFNNKTKVTQQAQLVEKLIEATRLGNIHHGKVGIIFEDDEGLKRVDTTIWSTGAKYICLKGGVWLPIDRIREVIL